MVISVTAYVGFNFAQCTGAEFTPINETLEHDIVKLLFSSIRNYGCQRLKAIDTIIASIVDCYRNSDTIRSIRQ